MISVMLSVLFGACCMLLLAAAGNGMQTQYSSFVNCNRTTHKPRLI